MRNVFLAGVLVLLGVAGMLNSASCASPVQAAASTSEVGEPYKVGPFVHVPISIKWPLSTDVSELVTFPAVSGPAVMYVHWGFQDQDLPAGGVAGTSTGVVATKQEHCFVDVEDHTGIAAYQYTVLRTEFDGTAATQNSVVSVGEFIFSPITGWFDPST